MQPSPQDPHPWHLGGAAPEGSQEFDLGPLHTLMQPYWKETENPGLVVRDQLTCLNWV